MFNLFTCDHCGAKSTVDMIKIDHDLDMVCPHCHSKTHFTRCPEDMIRTEVKDHVSWHLNSCFGRDYAMHIPDEAVARIVDDIMETTSIHMEGVWNDDDVRLAAGRVLLKNYLEGESQGV